MSIQVKRFNESVAVWAVHTFSSMGCFWALFVFTLLPLIPALTRFSAVFSYISSSSIQLWALPLLGVGNILMSKNSEKQREEVYTNIIEMHNELVDLHAQLRELVLQVHEKVQ